MQRGACTGMSDMRHEALKLLWAEINETRRRQAEAERVEDPAQRAEAVEGQRQRRAVLEWIEGEVRNGEDQMDEEPNECWDCVNGCNREEGRNG